MGSPKRSRTRRAPSKFSITRGVALGVAFTVYLLSDAPAVLRPQSGVPCSPDDEGSWSIGIFRGPSPLNLTPIEALTPRGPSADAAAAWPVANPVLTCASVTDGPSNFVADPFLFAPAGVPRSLGAPGSPPLHLFFESKNSALARGEIAVAESLDGGATWRYLGVALQERWHLSYPHVFTWQDQIYMMPEGAKSGALRLYKAINYPLGWQFVTEMVPKPLIDASLAEWQGRWYLFATDPTRPGYKRNAELQIFHADSPLGPWFRHYLNPVMFGNPRAGARSAGRVVTHNGRLYRFGQDCGGTYGRNVVAFRIDTLNPREYDQTRVKFTARRAERQGAGAWNGVRRHHVDALQLRDGTWLAAMDGDWQESGALTRPLVRRAVGAGVAWAAAAVVLVLVAADTRYARSHLPISGFGSMGDMAGLIGGGGGGMLSRKADKPSALQDQLLPPPVKAKLRRAWRSAAAGAARWAARAARRAANPSLLFRLGSIACGILSLIAAAVVWYYLSLAHERPVASAAVPVHSVHSRYTIVIPSHPPRLGTLRTAVAHYGRCPGAQEIVVVWAGEVPAGGLGLASAVPVRVRQEPHASLNNRFRPDPALITRGVLSLDDDTLLSCADVEAAFAEWRLRPGALVGFHPRLLGSSPARYRGERTTLAAGSFNALLTGGAFLDADRWFPAYWDAALEDGRGIVDRHFNCEDILMNFLVAAAAGNGTAPLRFVRPRRRLDTSTFSGIGISKAWAAHLAARESCIEEFARLFGEFPLRETPLVAAAGAGRGPVCWLPFVGCIYF